MADEEQEQNDDNTDAPASGGKKKLLLLLLVGLVLIGVSVGGTVAVLSMLQPEAVPEEGEQLEQEPVEAPPKPAIYYALKPEYILNIEARGRRRYLRLDLTVMTREDDVIAALELHRATVDHIVTLVAGGQIFEEVQTAEGKEFLRLQLLKELQTAFEKEIGKPGIEQVLFTNFVMQ
ncbi:flagellar basal body-associated FliL family protein [Agaribacterium haliotis]|uniref:flagellar basal body-associated FliL family protein n=1 Tax=Agaribacterium haliotis TaxID=2013869 RepID=UPI000BB57151|nr:flagellar basal body-associated FliL family protein [Agaribacterium haliotis]